MAAWQQSEHSLVRVTHVSGQSVVAEVVILWIISHSVQIFFSHFLKKFSSEHFCNNDFD